ncbi:hypothetical protein [Bradyrhizobium sp. SZCCHNR3058]|uniref:hypothetical protein n=2 Tax=Bradyrhizobium TaxID=374 RepID=UPI0029164DF5|nr:hypothetical protein [Bradyrhizobium sp. SZCCHNR3058]
MKLAMSDITNREAMRLLLIESLVNFSGNEDLRSMDPNAGLQEVFDSLGHFTFLMSLEEQFQRQISDDKFTLTHMGTINGILDVLSESKAVEPKQVNS